LRDYDEVFNTHGIDLYSPPDDPTSVYICAVNHLPNPEYYASGSPSQSKDSKVPKARSRLEVFHHVIGSSEATHVRSIWHQLIRTPNDIYIKSLQEIYVTNDHYYRDGLMRLVEDVAYGSVGPQTDLIHLHISDPLSPPLPKKNGVVDDTAGVIGTVANQGIHNNNGLGHGRTPSEILVCRTAIGQLLLAEEDRIHPPTLNIKEIIQLPCTLDNPSYFSDPYAEKTGRDASGFVLAGLARAVVFPNGMDPPMVWLVQPKTNTSRGESGSKDQEGWTQKLIFQDDGHILRSASTAVLVAIDPDTNMGKKQGWLFVTGPVAKGIVATRIDL
jgi:hypothetical protein